MAFFSNLNLPLLIWLLNIKKLIDALPLKKIINKMYFAKISPEKWNYVQFFKRQSYSIVADWGMRASASQVAPNI